MITHVILKLTFFAIFRWSGNRWVDIRLVEDCPRAAFSEDTSWSHVRPLIKLPTLSDICRYGSISYQTVFDLICYRSIQ